MPSMRKPNRLKDETSPYLQQHATNPVDWYPWGNEALGKARREQKPIFLSIGYSACHWCHVMEHESFEDEETAKLMNERFVNIKVDREERPDLDHIYMTAVQAMTQHGGWPMSVFLTPDLEPFYGGTYFPPSDRMGMPSFRRVLMSVANAWASKRAEVLKSAKQLTEALKSIDAQNATPNHDETLSFEALDRAAQVAMGNLDPYYGGFGSQPKFFHTTDLRMLLREWSRKKDPKALAAVTLTLDHIARGGIFDHLGGGFHRYSTDAKWLVPHFEKMLYDNALLAETYLEAFTITKKTQYASTAREILDYVLRQMTSPEGGFYSTEDADSEGVEGKFYVWTQDEIYQHLEKESAEQFCRVFNISADGNWEGNNILHLQQSIEDIAKSYGLDVSWLEDSLQSSKRKLFAIRNQRIKPGRDEKILVSWNAMMIRSMALAYQILDDERYLHAAQNAATFIIEKMGAYEDGSGPLQHAYKDGRARFPAYLDDFAGFALSLATLYESDFNEKWLDTAQGLTEQLLTRFWDPSEKTFFYTAKDHEKLIHRPREVHDGATPSGTAIAITALAHLGHLTLNETWIQTAHQALTTHAQFIRSIPGAAGQMLIAFSSLRDSAQEIVICFGKSEEENEAALKLIRSEFLPNRVVVLANPNAKRTRSLSRGKYPIQERVTVFFCENFTCLAPIVGLEPLERHLKSVRETP